MSGKTIIPKRYKQTEVGVIPEDWDCRTVKDLVEMGVLEQPQDGNHGNIHPKSGDYVTYGIPFVMANNVHGGHVDLNNCMFIRKSQADSLQKGFSRSGDVLLTHKATIGNTAVVGEIPFEYIMLAPQVTYYRVADPSHLSNYYLRHYFDSLQFQKILISLSGGGTRAYIGITAQLELPIILPPSKSEQEAIATALSDADALIESLERLIVKKRDIKQAAMQQLLTGQTRLPVFISTNGFKQSEVGIIPNDWYIDALGELAKLKSGESITNSSINQASAFPCYGGNGLRGYTSRYTHDGIYALIGRQGALCGNVQLVSGKFYASEHAIVVTSQDKVDIRWLFYILKYMNLNRYSESSAQPGLSVGKLLSLSIPTPSKGEQTAVAAVISDMDAEIAALEVRWGKIKLLKQGMMQELLTGRIRLV